MRTPIRSLILGALLGCGGGKPPPASVVESCDNQRDDDGDGLVDCADPDCDGRCDTSWSTTSTGTPGTTPTTPTTSFTGTTGTTNPASPLTLSIDPTIHLFQHQVGLTACPQNIGRIIATNTSSEQAQLIVWSDRYQGEDLFSFQLDTNPIEFWVDFPIPAGQQGVVTVYYACTAQASFIHFIQVDFVHGSDPSLDNGALIQSQGNIL